jgi:hypothetical protein
MIKFDEVKAKYATEAKELSEKVTDFYNRFKAEDDNDDSNNKDYCEALENVEESHMMLQDFVAIVTGVHPLESAES